MDESLRAVLRPRICQVDARVRRGIGAYRHEGGEVRRAVAVVGRLCDRLGLVHLDRDLNPGRGKTQLVLAMRDGRGEPVVLKVYGKRRPNEAVVQGLWGEAGVATAGILAAGDDPVSWMLMPLLPGHPEVEHPRAPADRHRAAQLGRLGSQVHNCVSEGRYKVDDRYGPGVDLGYV